MTIITVSIVHSTAENNRPMTAKFFAYPCVVPRISRKISRAVCCFSTPGCEIFGFTDELNSPMAAPRPYPNVVMKSLFYLLLQLSAAAAGQHPSHLPSTQAMNDLKKQLSKTPSTSFSSFVLIETGPTFFGIIISSRYLRGCSVCLRLCNLCMIIWEIVFFLPLHVYEMLCHAVQFIIFKEHIALH